MALTSNIDAVWYCLCYFLVYGANAATTSFEIERGKYDTFRNVNCQLALQLCTSDQCQSYQAECADNKCERCRCSKDGGNTFVTSGSNAGICTKDENVIPISGGEFIKNSKGECLGVIGETIVEVPCNENDLSLRWLRIQALNYLLNVKTLKCLQRNIKFQEITAAQCKELKTTQQWSGAGTKFIYISLDLKTKTLHSNLFKPTTSIKSYTGNRE